MSLTTLLVCDDPNRLEQVETLIKSQKALEHVATVARQAAAQQIKDSSPKVVWVELAPDPDAGLKLLAELKEQNQDVQFLVSYERLQADLVKSAMQHGAVEYIDPDGAHRLLPGAVARIERIITTPPPAPVKPTLAPPPPLVVHSTEPHEKVVRNVSGMRSKEAMMELGWGGLPYWVMPAVVIILVIAAVVLAFIKH